MAALPTLADLKSGAVILVDKPFGWTSFDAINKIRKYINTKIGHCGTLDPLATGLLICCTGKMTKQISRFQNQDKEYTGIIELGATTPTYDLESEPENFKPTSGLSLNAVKQMITQHFLGTIEQIPPAHSAVKIRGKRSYELARAGLSVAMKPRVVTIHDFEIVRFELPEIHFRIACSTGTYIRSLANDLGAALGYGGYLKKLRRTKIGDFSADDAPSIEEWVQHLKEEMH